MAQRKDRKKDPNKESIFNESTKDRVEGKKLVKKGRNQELQKMEAGFKYVLLGDGKTRVLRKC